MADEVRHWVGSMESGPLVRGRHLIPVAIETCQWADEVIGEEYFAEAPFQKVELVFELLSEVEAEANRPPSVRIRRVRGGLEASVPVVIPRARTTPEQERQLFREALAKVVSSISSIYGLRLPDQFAAARLQSPFLSEGAVDAGVDNEVVVRYQTTRDVERDLEVRKRAEEAINRALADARLGFCSGTDYGNGTMSIFCTVSDSRRAEGLIRSILHTQQLLTGAAIEPLD